MPFSQHHADIACNFFEKLLKHSGEWTGDPFLLTPWEAEALDTIFGTLDENGEREIKLAYLEVPKKAGKTEFVAGLVILMLVMDKYPGCQVYGAASAQRQALNVYQAATSMVDQSKELSKRLRILRSTHRILKRNDPNSFYAAIAADGDLTDGVNPKFVVADELHRWKTRKQLENWDVLRMGGIARKSKPLTIAITTAGVQKDSPLAWRLHEKTIRIKAGVIDDPTFYGRIYGADPKDDWTKESTWIKANPSLEENGGFLKLEKIRDEYNSSLSEVDSQVAFRRYYLNLWDQKVERAIDMQQWGGCQGEWTAKPLLPLPPEDKIRPVDHEVLARFIDRSCWVGVDLSFSTDMSAVTFVFPWVDGGGYDFLPFYWLPKANLKKAELRDGMPYTRWVEEGWLEACEGTAIDYGDVKERILWGTRMFDVRKLCFDRYNANEMSSQLQTDGHECEMVRQDYTGLSEATKKFLHLIATATLGHGGHPVLTWNASCLSLKRDDNGLVRPIKPSGEKDSTRIDGITAGITALSRAILAEPRLIGCPVVII